MQEPPFVSFSIVSRVLERPVNPAPNCNDENAPESKVSSPAAEKPSTLSVTSVPDRPM